MTHRILHIVPSLACCGTARQVALLAAGMPPAEFELRVAVLDRLGPVVDELARLGVPVTDLERRSSCDLAAWWRLRRLVAEFRPVVVHAWGTAAMRMAVTAGGNARAIVTERHIEPVTSDTGAFIDRFLAKRAALIAINSSAVHNKLNERRWPADKQVLIPDGVALAREKAVVRADLLSELRLPANARLLAAVGRLTLDRNVKDLIWATDMLKFIRDDVHLLIVGEGPHRARLERFREQCEIADRVHFLGERGNVSRILSASDVFCCAGGTDGASLALIEAMQQGVPVVAADTPANREVIITGESGSLVPLGDRAAFARQFHRLLEDPALAKRIGAAARQRAGEQFSADQMIDRYSAMYDAVISGRR